MTQRYVVMGVSGCGKSTIGQGVAKAIGAAFVDGDDLHPESNIQKMSRGEPLNDTDRAPWLDLVGETLSYSSGATVIACSALKRAYRDRIRAAAEREVVFLFLEGSPAVLAERMTTRPGHFMPPALLDSQLATLETPTMDEPHVKADIDQPPEAVITTLLTALKESAL